MRICPICGSKFSVPHTKDYVFKKSSNYIACSYSCFKKMKEKSNEELDKLKLLRGKEDEHRKKI